MLKRKSAIILSIVLVLISVCFCALLFVIHQDLNQTEESTVEYYATVKAISIPKAGENSGIMIYSNEYSNNWYITPELVEGINLDSVKNIKTNQNIIIRIRNGMESFVNNTGMVHVVALSAEGENILSLEQHNTISKQNAQPAFAAAGVVAVILLMMSILNIILHIRRNKICMLKQGSIPTKP